MLSGFEIFKFFVSDHLKQVFLRYRFRISHFRGSYVAFKPGSHMPWESPFCTEQLKNCFLLPFEDSYRIVFVA